ncbi:MAG: hypothetical protein IPJ65_16200 [Archangiaceae bacterium]|nr:hypothetical protein [Archangiaceae bacterium]
MQSDLKWLRDEVVGMYRRNRQQGHAPWANLDYDFVCPSMETYPFQWLWDSCFHAVVLSHFDVKRACGEMECLLQNQQPDGFLGHVTFWQREKFENVIANYDIAWRNQYVTDCIQPPLLAEAVEAAVVRGASTAWLKTMLPKLRGFYDWLDQNRDPDRDGLIAVVQADETGLDHSPKWDALIGSPALTTAAFTEGWKRVAKPYEPFKREHAKMFALDHFIVEDVMVNTIYVKNLQVMAGLYQRVGDAASAAEMKRRADLGYGSLLTKCWSEEKGMFFDLVGHRAEKHLTHAITFTVLMPLLFPELPAPMARRLIAHLEDEKLFAAAFPVPTVAVSDPSFDPGPVGPRLVWRGPSWMNSNWYLARGLRAHGRDDLSQKLEQAMLAAIRQHGFREYYQPFTGEGYGAPDFSWTGLILDLYETREARG